MIPNFNSTDLKRLQLSRLSQLVQWLDGIPCLSVQPPDW